MFRKRDEGAAKKLDTMTDKIQMIEFVRNHVNQDLEDKIRESEMLFERAEKIRETLDVCLSALQDHSPELAKTLRAQVGKLKYVQ